MASTRTQRRRASGDFVRLPGSRRPFYRAQELHQKFIDQLAALADALPVDRQIALDALPPYTSRGHGGRHRPSQRIIGGAWSQDRSIYGPLDDTTAGLVARAKQKMVRKSDGYDRAALMAFADSVAARTKHDPRAL